MFGPIHLPSIMNFSLDIQQRVKHTVVDVSYVGGLSRHLYATKNWNAIPMFSQFTNLDPTQVTKTPLANSLLVPYVGYGTINLNQPQASANFNSLQATITRRLANSLQIGVAYTFSKALGVDSINPYFAPRQYDYGPEAITRAQSLVFNYVYAIPDVGKRLGFKAAGYVLDHWSLSGITTFQSGAPFLPTFTTTAGTNITGSTLGARITVVGDPHASDPGYYFNRAAFAVTPVGSFGNAGPGILRGPGINNWDMSATKKIPLRSESRYLQLRLEAFNAWNHTQFASVNSAASFNPAGQQINGLFGTYVTARTPRIVQLSARIVF
jgi:hypothetical protein